MDDDRDGAAPAKTPARPAQARRILEAAAVCFARSGFRGASMHDICAEAGMSAGNLYRYFRSKEAIVVAISEDERETNAALFDILERSEDPVAGLVACARLHFSDMAQRGMQALCTEIFAEAQRNPEIRAPLERNLAEAHAAVAAALRRGMTSGYIDPAVDVDVAVRLLFATVDGLAAHRAMAPFMTDERLDATFTQLIERFLRPPAR